MTQNAIDPRFRVEVLNQALDPQQAIYAAMHTDYSEEFVFDELSWLSSYDTASFYNRVGITEEEAGDRVVKNLLNGNRGHFGCLEHPQIIFNCGWFPHSVMQQVRTHRVGISFDVQSFRYTGNRIYQLGDRMAEMGLSAFSGVEEKLFCYDEDDSLKAQVENVFYLRPLGEYTDRQGSKYQYSEERRNSHLIKVAESAVDYYEDIKSGMSEEHARGLIPFDVRQHFVMSVNVRSLMHLLDLRAKADAQLECRQLCELIFPHFEKWTPAIAQWYKENRLGKARLSP